MPTVLTHFFFFMAQRAHLADGTTRAVHSDGDDLTLGAFFGFNWSSRGLPLFLFTAILLLESQGGWSRGSRSEDDDDDDDADEAMTVDADETTDLGGKNSDVEGEIELGTSPKSSNISAKISFGRTQEVIGETKEDICKSTSKLGWSRPEWDA